MRFKHLVFLVILCYLINLSAGCHRRRRRRSTTTWYLPYVTVQSFFPTCMVSKALSRGVLTGRSWKGPVSFALFHSTWYEEADSFCTSQGDKPECWLSKIGDFINSDSPTLDIVRECIKDYYRVTTGSKLPIPEPPTPSPRHRMVTCPAVDRKTYDQELRKRLNTMEFAGGDSAVEDLSGLVDFVQDDLICLNCSCDALSDEADTEVYDFEDGKSCGECWVTRLPTAVRKGSGFRRPGRSLAKEKGNLRKRKRPDKRKPPPHYFVDKKKPFPHRQANPNRPALPQHPPPRRNPAFQLPPTYSQHTSGK